MKTGIGGKMSDKKSVLEEVMKDMEDGKEIKIPSTSIKDFVERKYGMSDKRYIVPEGMLKAVSSAYGELKYSQSFVLTEKIRLVLCEAAMRWLSENRTLPDEKVVRELLEDSLQYWFVGDTALKKEAALSIHTRLNDLWSEWQRRMFLAPEPETICILKKGGEVTVNINTRMIICPAHPDGHKLDVELKKCKDSGGFMIGDFTKLKDRHGSCPSCAQGQSLERGEGTHLEGTVEHPEDRWTKHEVAEAIRRNYHYTDTGDGEIFITKILADLDPPSKPEVPDEIKDLLSSSDHIIGIPLLSGLTEHGKVVILEAYRRGKESGK
jgi:hypothetical protein